MRYVCIDIETTGLDPETCQVIEFAAVIRDTSTMDIPLEESPSFHCYVKHPTYSGDAYALALNARVLEQLGSKRPDAPAVSESELIENFYEFLVEQGYKPSAKNCRIHLVAAGKNFGNFDLQFLQRIKGWKDYFNISSRIMDPAMLWLEPDDNRVPGLGKCMERAGIEGKVTHHALNDVYDTIRTLELGIKKLWL